MSIRSAAITIGLTFAALGCGRDDAKNPLPGDDTILAQVDQQSITQYDLELAARSMLGKSNAEALDDAARRQLLESLVQSRAIAKKRESELTPAERAELDKRVMAFREELLVKQYLTKHTKLKPISAELVERYYAQNQARFGAEPVRAYELITSPRELTESERASLLTSLRDPLSHKDWAGWIAELQKKRVPVIYQRGTSQNGITEAPVRGLVAQLGVGQASHLTFAAGRPYLVRVTEESRAPAKPLAAVSGEIRQALMPTQVKRSVEEASAIVMKDTQVVYR